MTQRRKSFGLVNITAVDMVSAVGWIRLGTCQLCVCLTGKHEGLEAEKQSCQEDDRRRSGEEIEELEFKHYQSDVITLSIS